MEIQDVKDDIYNWRFAPGPIYVFLILKTVSKKYFEISSQSVSSSINSHVTAVFSSAPTYIYSPYFSMEAWDMLPSMLS